ncbi:MAG: FG-GAP repeat domain-containing protein [Burkholderiales bacterium]
MRRRTAVSAVACGLLIALVSAVSLYREPKTSGFVHVVIDKNGPREPWGKSVGDLNGDGLPDLLAGGNSPGELVWYENPAWKKKVIATGKPFSTDHEIVDIDRDGKNDIVSLTKGELIWYRNPDWQPFVIDAVQLHDIELADFDGDGDLDIAGRDQSAFGGSGDMLIFYRQDSPSRWKKFTVPCPDGEGLAVADLNGDGKPDVIVNNNWYQNTGELGQWIAWSYSKTWQWPHTTIGVGDINQDGRPDIVLAPAELEGGKYRVSWFEALEKSTVEWPEHLIDMDVESVHHFVGVADMNNDGMPDIVAAEMHQGEDPDEVKIYLNQEKGSAWTKKVIANTGSHAMRIVDIDSDGDLDLYGANWSGEHQPIELWINETCSGKEKWKRHVVDAKKPWPSVFIASADMNGDGLKDIVTGGWWYKNPGRASGSWVRNVMGKPANNLAAVFDFDGDGHMDVLATDGKPDGGTFVWARNEGDGTFKIVADVAKSAGDFLQGVAIARFSSGGPIEVALSWHAPNRGIEMITVPPKPDSESWPLRTVSRISQDEALSSGDIDRDGDTDLLLGTKWLRNDGNAWSEWTITATRDAPDRNLLVDMNKDGHLDAVVGYEAISVKGKVAWYEQQEDTTAAWVEHVIGEAIGPMSLDVADIDKDGDLDVIVGEHNLKAPAEARLIIFENRKGAWIEHVIYTGDEHHDGAHAVDIDNDGDTDIVSIGWGHNEVILYENKSCGFAR